MRLSETFMAFTSVITCTSSGHSNYSQGKKGHRVQGGLRVLLRGGGELTQVLDIKMAFTSNTSSGHNNTRGKKRVTGFRAL